MAKGRPAPTAVYDARAFRLGAVSLNVFYDEIKKLPGAPLRPPLSHANALRYQVCLYAIGVARSATEIGEGAQRAWFGGQFLAASVLIRVLLELWGAMEYAEQRVLRKIEESDLTVADARILKLLAGSNTGVTHSPAVRVEVSPVNVMEFVRSADVVSPGIIDEYKFLCDAAHPTFMAGSHLLFAGAIYDNWTNETFAKNMHPVLDRTLKAGEAGLAGIERTGMAIVARCIPPIREEVVSWPQRTLP